MQIFYERKRLWFTGRVDELKDYFAKLEETAQSGIRFTDFLQQQLH